MDALEPTTDPSGEQAVSPRRRRILRPAVLVPAGVVMAGLLAFVLIWFQPQKLFIDDRVDQAAPVGATPVTAAPAPVEPTPTTVSPTTAAPTAPAPPTTPVVATTPPVTIAPPSAPAPVASEFVSLDHGTSGRLVLLQDGQGQRFLRFEGFRTSNGPDVHVYLSTNPVDGPEASFDDDYVHLGRLQGNIGDQNYAVAPDVDLSRFRSVVVWCDRFNSAFGAAPLA